MGTYDKNGPQLHVIDPSGTSFRYFGAAVGKGRQSARNEIEKLKLSGQCCLSVCAFIQVRWWGENRYILGCTEEILPPPPFFVDGGEEMTCREAVVEAAKILHRVHDEESKPFEIEMSWICDESEKAHQRVPADILAAAEAQAKASMQEDDMED